MKSLNYCLFKEVEMNNGVQASLYKAVSIGDVQKVKDILSTGVEVNFPIKEWNGESTLLHYAVNPEIVRELIVHGATVNAIDYNGRTPLHNAVSNAKGLYAVKELLKYGADPNARNYQGTTALTPAIINKNLEIIKELLEYGADINIRTTSPLLRYPTPLAVAVSAYQECAELLIKMTLIKNFNSGYKRVINLDFYTECDNYNSLSKFLDDCVFEIDLMKTVRANDYLSLLDFVLKKTENVKFLYPKIKDIGEHCHINFPIYHDYIINKLQLYLRRSSLFDRFRSIRICSILSVSGNEVMLNQDCLGKIAEYLSSDDLLLFVSAFNEHLNFLQRI